MNAEDYKRQNFDRNGGVSDRAITREAELCRVTEDTIRHRRKNPFWQYTPGGGKVWYLKDKPNTIKETTK